MNSMPKHVVTGGLDPLGWNATRLAVAPTGPDLRTAVGELRLMVYPVLVGGGLPIFPDDRGLVPLELTDLVRYDTGVLLQTYRPAA
jgi:hypothetical protein